MTTLALLAALTQQTRTVPTILRDSDGKYACEILVARITVPDPRLGWGFDNDPPKTRVGRFNLRHGSKKVDVPPSAWADLAAPREVGVESSKEGCLVTLTGGDASGSYRASIRVRGETVMERVVRSGEFPKEHFEKTVYVNLPPAEGR